jgi:DNA repair photolyase
MLNESKGNMYDFVTHTWNTVKGECPHGCSYCYMHRWGKQKPVRFDEKELKTDLGSGNFIFVGSSCDMFAKDIPDEWIKKTLEYCGKFDNKYLFQTKNPGNVDIDLPAGSVVCVTLETNRWYPEIMVNSPRPSERFVYLQDERHPLYITVEPIMDFDLDTFVQYLTSLGVMQINIGADTGNNHLPEPPKEKILELITELSKFTTVHQKSNLKRLLK